MRGATLTVRVLLAPALLTPLSVLIRFGLACRTVFRPCELPLAVVRITVWQVGESLGARSRVPLL